MYTLNKYHSVVSSIFYLQGCITVVLCVLSLRVVSGLIRDLRNVALQAPLSMGFPRQEYWSGLPFPRLGGLPHPEIEPMFPALAGGFFTS